MNRYEIKALGSAIGKTVFATVVVHMAQKYALKAVDAVEYKIVTKHRKKKRVGFYR